MSLALVRKEVREHGWVLGALVVLEALSLAGLLVNASDQGGRFAALVRFTGAFGSLGAVVTANRLFAREYSGRTQLFLEVLPVTRARVLATKWLTGAAFQGGLVALAWAVTLAFMRRTEVVSFPDALRALVAAQAFTLALWGYAAMAGLLGRYRYVAWLAVGFFLYVLDEVAKVPLREAPLLCLLNDARAMARTPVPARALLEAAVVTVGAALVTFALGLRGSGALAAALARRMTARERVFVIASFAVALVVADRLQKERQLPPFELAEATRATATRSVVGVMTTDDVDQARARDLGQAVAADVDALAAALGLPKPPPVFLLPQRGLEPTHTERAGLGKAQGIVLRAAPDGDASVLRARVLHELLVDATDGRGRLEDRHALLDGLAVWWASRDDVAQQETWRKRATASAVPLSRASVLRWNETSERLGDCVANAVAFSLVDTLAASAGPDAVQRLGARLFPKPGSALASALQEPAPEALLRELGTDWDGLTRAAEARRLAVATAHHDELAARPAPTAHVALRREGGAGVVTVRVDGVERWRALYGRLGPWSRGQWNLPRLDVRGPTATLPVTLARGERLLAVVEYDDAVLGCPVRVAAQRLEAP